MERDIKWYMNPFYLLRDLISRAFDRKWALISLLLLVLCSIMCGIAFVKTPVFYEYSLRICDRFLDRVCYSDRDVFVIFLERTLGNVFVLILLLLGGLHPATLIFPTTALAFRAYTFGGTLTILFSVYRVSGALIVFTLYLPIHLLIDVIFLLAASLSFSRAFCFRFCGADFNDLLIDLGVISALVVIVCLLEMILLGVLFHPLGNLL